MAESHEEISETSSEYSGPKTATEISSPEDEVITVPEDDSSVVDLDYSNVDFHIACARCKKTYAETKQRPKLLPCLHSLCDSCLLPVNQNEEGFASIDTGQGVCPKCGFIFDLCTVIDYLQVQERLNKQALTEEMAPGEPTTHECTGCEEKELGTSFCTDCEEWLCEQCVVAHKRVKVTKDHQIVAKEDAPRAEVCKKHEAFLFCKLHKQEKLMFFCEKCDILTCRDCQLVEHKDHKYQFLDVAATNCKASLLEKLTEMQDRASRLSQLRTYTDKKLCLVKEQHSDTVKQVQAQADALIKQIITSARTLLQNAKVACETMAKRLTKESIDVGKVLVNFEYSIDFIKTLIQDGSNMALLSSKSTVFYQCERIYTVPIETAATKNTFAVQYRHDTPFLFNNLGKFGHIFVNNAKYHPQDRSHVQSPPQVPPPPYAVTTQSDQSRHMIMALQKAAASNSQQQLQQSMLKLKQQQQQVVTQQIQQAAAIHSRLPHQPLVMPQSVSNLVSSMRQPQANGWSSQPVFRPNINPNLGFQRGVFPPQQPFQPMRLQHRPAAQQSVYSSNPSGVQVQTQPGRPVQFRGPPPLIRSPNTSPASSTSTTPPSTATHKPNTTASVAPRVQSPSLPSGVRVKMERMSSETDCVITASKFKGERSAASSSSGSSPKAATSPGPPSSVNPPNGDPTDTSPRQTSEFVKSLEDVLEKVPMELGETFEDIDNSLLTTSNLNKELKQNTQQPAVKSKGKHGSSAMMTDMSYSDPNEDYCACCHNGGEVLCCDTCPRVFHLNCHIPPLAAVPKYPIYCLEKGSGVFVCTLCSTDDNIRVSSPIPEESLANGNKRKAPGGLTDKEIKICERIMLDLFCNAGSVAFHEPVSKQVPNYYKIIQEPMDFMQIKCKLARQHFNHYNSVQDFLADVKLVFYNCSTYNQESSEVGKAGRTVQLFFEDMVSKYMPYYASFTKKYPSRGPAVIANTDTSVPTDAKRRKSNNHNDSDEDYNAAADAEADEDNDDDLDDEPVLHIS